MIHWLWLINHLSSIFYRINTSYLVRNVKPRYIMVYLKWSDDFSRVPNIHPPIILSKARMKQFKIYEAQIRAILQRNLLPINHLSDSLKDINNDRQSEIRNGSARAQSDCEWQQAHKIDEGGRIFEMIQTVTAHRNSDINA